MSAEPATLARQKHAMHCQRCLAGLPSSQLELDSSRVAVAFYCLGTLDLLGRVEKVGQGTRDGWRAALWELQTSGPDGTGFKPSLYMTPDPSSHPFTLGPSDSPHLIMTYTALLSLSILRDPFAQLDRAGLARFVRACQRPDGGFASAPGARDGDLRLTYCAAAVCAMLGRWEVDVQGAVGYIARCRSYEGGYGQEPFGEALGGTTYCALAALSLFASSPSPPPTSILSRTEKTKTVRWLAHNQRAPAGGFAGRTNKPADACYCFWCGASLAIMGVEGVVDGRENGRFLAECQFRFGGIAKAPGEHPDPYHTYLSLAALAIFPVADEPGFDESFELARLDPLLNATEETARWAREHIPASREDGQVDGVS